MIGSVATIRNLMIHHIGFKKFANSILICILIIMNLKEYFIFAVENSIVFAGLALMAGPILRLWIGTSSLKGLLKTRSFWGGLYLIAAISYLQASVPGLGESMRLSI